MSYKITTADTKANFAIKAKYPTRKAAERILKEDKDSVFIDQVISCTDRQVRSWLNTAQVAIMDEAGNFYPVDSKNVTEQFDLVVAGETPTVTANAGFGVLKIEQYIKDPIAAGQEATVDVLDKPLNVIQNEVSIQNGVITGTLYKVTDYTGFNGKDVNEQNGYYLVFYADISKMPDNATYSDIKFFVVGGSGNKVAMDEGLNVIFLGATKEEALKKTLGVTAHLTVTSDTLGEFEKDVESVFINRLNYIDPEEKLVNKKPDKLFEGSTGQRPPSWNAAKKFLFLNGNAATIFKDEAGKTLIELDETHEIIDVGETLDAWYIFGGGAAGSKYKSSKITQQSGTVKFLIGGGFGDSDKNFTETGVYRTADVDKTEIIVNGGKNSGIVGGSALAGTVNEAYITVNGGDVYQVGGGGFAYWDATDHLDRCKMDPSKSQCIVNEAFVTINGGKFQNNHIVYGGGQGYCATHKAVLNINHVDTPKTNGWYISAGSNGYCGESEYNINCPDTELYICHTQNRGYQKKSTMNIYAGTINNLYPIQEEADTASNKAGMIHEGILESATVNIYGGKINSLKPGFNGQNAVAANDPKVAVYVYDKAVVDDIDDAKTAFGTSLVIMK